MVQSVYAILSTGSFIMNIIHGGSWESKKKKKLDERNKQFRKEWLVDQSLLNNVNENSTVSVIDLHFKTGILTDKEIKITQFKKITDLLSKIHSGELSSLEVTIAFCKRAQISQQLTNCLTEVMFNEAIERAKYLDDYFTKNNGKIVGPLHGLPISVKDCFALPNFDSTTGLISYIGNKDIPNNFASLPRQLYDLGAVFYVKTNVPQFMMTCDSDNNLFGRTLNPLNLSLTAGGSSGGEGSILGQHGSILGIGSDIGGSIRIPSMACGVYGFKPSSDSIPFDGIVEPNKVDQTGNGIECTAGPLSVSMDGIEIFLKSVFDSNPSNYDKSLKKTSFNHDLYNQFKDKKNLKIGLLLEDPQFPIHPTIKYNLLKQAEILKTQGFEIIDLSDKFQPLYTLWNHAVRSFTLDIFLPTLWGLMKTGEPPVPSLNTLHSDSFGLPPFTKTGVQNLVLERKEIRSIWNRLFDDLQLDAIISPGCHSTAPAHDTYGIPIYTTIWNVTNYPACVIPCGDPVGSIEEAEIVKSINSLKESLNIKTSYLKKNEKTYAFCLNEYNSSVLKNGKPHIQVVTRYFEDEKLLAISKTIDSIINDI
ncbi:hypothetical protein BVG19_g4268 [[Candida] boidinii]|nr:hypothetical protein BVG19_g4268 [[Candida] boidinii]OWB53232.1 hypothetical protein B5S27_g4825 [[Candida] boidinii]